MTLKLIICPIKVVLVIVPKYLFSPKLDDATNSETLKGRGGRLDEVGWHVWP